MSNDKAVETTISTAFFVFGDGKRFGLDNTFVLRQQQLKKTETNRNHLQRRQLDLRLYLRSHG